jgi:hypothetical protein
MDRPRILQRIVPGVWTVAVFVAVALVGAATARADDKGAATAVVTSQLELLKKQAALNKCLAASPKKNTPCIRQKALSLATLAGREVKLIKAAMDGTEKPCVQTVALQEIAYLQIWRSGALALYRNERKKARRIFLSSLKLETAQRQLQPTCLTGVLTGP